ncbi:ATPase [Sphingomonas sp. S1-29]|uniref:ATP12 family chaperone protein n=1 Tax=Sphingomonas sp. S1-29 TaxID=2991074 RepID=UPI0022403CC7|nr:ATP12 family protein [Sphingomonas sp. S1-29]UZK70831.1 ATPase [Sphingomonas sp. S1-29]
MKRFWRDVAVQEQAGGWGISLDERPVRTPGRVPLLVPTPGLIEAIAQEWRAVETDIDPRAMPLTGLANAAIDRIAPDPAAFARALAAYGASDLLCYRADAPAPLADRQRAAWDSVLDWARGRYDVHFALAIGVMPVTQPAATLERLGDAIAARSPFELAPLSVVVTITGSLVLALALIEGAADADSVWTAANIDEDWQAEMWGEDSLATQSRAVRSAEYTAANTFLALLNV